MKTLLLIASLLFAASSFAETVKVVSRLGISDANGSGWLVQTAMGPIVITCPHVLIPSGAVEIYFEKSSMPIAAHEVWSDWARGISLLKLDSQTQVKISERFDSTSAIADASYSRGDKVRVEGFPAAQMGEALHAGGRVAIAQTHAAFLPFAEGIELIETHAELGMSCGPVFKADTGRVIGILSNQIAEVIADRETKISSFKVDKIYENAFAVSVREIAKALNRYFQEGSDSGDFKLLTTPQDESMRVGYGQFEFTFKEGKDRSFKVAGGTGAGVGGPSRTVPGSIEVTYNSKTKEKAVPAHLRVFFDNWKNVLLARRSVVIDGFVTKDKQRGYVRKEFDTIEQFVRYLWKPDLIPYGPIHQDRSQLALVQKTATELRERVLAIKELQRNSDSNLLLENLLSSAALLSEDFGTSIVTQADLNELCDAGETGRFKKEWIQLFSDAELYSKAKDLMFKLFELRQLI